MSIDFKILEKLHEGFHEPSGTKNIFLAMPLNNVNSIKLKEGQNYGWFKTDELRELKTTWIQGLFLAIFRKILIY